MFFEPIENHKQIYRLGFTLGWKVNKLKKFKNKTYRESNKRPFKNSQMKEDKNFYKNDEKNKSLKIKNDFFSFFEVNK